MTCKYWNISNYTIDTYPMNTYDIKLEPI